MSDELEDVADITTICGGLNVVANPDNKTEAVAAAICLMGLAGEIGYTNMQPGEGNSTYRNRIIDAIYNMDAEMLNKGAKYEV